MRNLELTYFINLTRLMLTLHSKNVSLKSGMTSIITFFKALNLSIFTHSSIF